MSVWKPYLILLQMGVVVQPVSNLDVAVQEFF